MRRNNLNVQFDSRLCLVFSDLLHPYLLLLSSKKVSTPIGTKNRRFPDVYTKTSRTVEREDSVRVGRDPFHGRSSSTGPVRGGGRRDAVKESGPTTTERAVVTSDFV